MTTSTAAGHLSSPNAAQKSPFARMSTILSSVSGAKSWSMAAWKLKKHFQPTQQPDFENLGPHQNSGLAVIAGHYGVLWSRTDRGAHPFCLMLERNFRDTSENSNLHWGPSTQARVGLQSGPKIQEVPDKKNQNLLKNTNSKYESVSVWKINTQKLL